MSTRYAPYDPADYFKHNAKYQASAPQKKHSIEYMGHFLVADDAIVLYDDFVELWNYYELTASVVLRGDDLNAVRSALLNAFR